MKKIIFVLSVLVMLVAVSCSNPSMAVESSSSSSTPAPDKSPYEYVKPDCVNLADYTYVGDYIFADTMNFAEWKYSNSETDYLLAFEKIARVKNDNPATRIIRCNHNDPDTEISVIKATKYKIYVKTSVVESKSVNQFVFNTYFSGITDGYDGTKIRIVKESDTTFTIDAAEVSSNVLNNYVAY